MQIVFFGSSKYSLIGAEIIQAKLGISLIVTIHLSPLAKFAVEQNIPYVTTGKLTGEIIAEIAKAKPDFLVVEDYGLILPTKLLELPRYESLNIHHSLLPKYRGPSPAPAAILADEKISGASIIKMSNVVDAGDIYAQKEYILKSNETTDSLLKELNNLGGNLVVSVIAEIEKGQALRTKQDETKTTQTNFMKKSDGYIDISNIKPDEFNRKIRAYFPWPGVWSKVIINGGGEKIVKFLPNNLIQVEGKKEMSYKDFLNGYPNANKKLVEFLKTEL
jgi:methionyl-tRNA formyltransferase